MTIDSEPGSGATGFYGSGGILVALAMGAGRVVAIGRDGVALASIAQALGPRVVAAAVTGHDVAADLGTIESAAGGRVDVALDMVGQASSTVTTLATLRALQRGGRLVLMGSSSVPLEIDFGEMLANDWEVVGNFMYPRNAPEMLSTLVASEQLDLAPIRLLRFPFDRLPDAIRRAASMRDLDLTVLDVAER